MRKIWTLALNDLRLTTRDWASAVWLVLLPLGMMWIFGSSFQGGSGEQPKIHLTVVNHDRGWLAEAFLDELRDEAVTLVEDESPTKGEPVRSLILPEGFTAGLERGQQQVLKLETRPDANIEYSLAAQMHLVRTIVRTLGRWVEMSASGDAATEDPAAAFRRLGERPPLATLEVSTAGWGRPIPSGFGQSVPGILTAITLMMTLIYGADFLTHEKTTGMLRRTATAPLSKAQIFAGKLLGRILLAGGQMVVIGLAGPWLFDFSWGDSPFGVALVMFAYAFAIAALSLLLGAILTSPQQASAVGWILSMFLAAIGGCWWPAEITPEWVQKLALTLPTGWAMEGFHGLITWGRGTADALPPVAVLIGFGLVFSYLGARLLRYD